jgi:N-formylglutamate amidohydrolase
MSPATRVDDKPLVDQETLETTRPSDAERRLARIAAQHTPYDEALDMTTGRMCRECGYLAPCPTNRMASGAIETDHAWLAPVAL